MRATYWFLIIFLISCQCARKQDADFYHREARKFQQKGDITKAIEFYKKAIFIEPHNVEINRDYQNFMRRVGKLDEILKEYKQKLDQNPNCPIFNYLYGRICLKEPEKYFKKAIELNPEFAPAYRGLAYFYQKQKKYGIAFENFQKFYNLQKNITLSDFLAWSACAHYSNKFSEEEKLLMEALERFPKSLEIQLRIGILFKTRGKISLAIKRFEKILKLDKNFWKVYAPLIQCYHAMHNFKAAQEIRKMAEKFYQKQKVNELRANFYIDVFKVADRNVMVFEELEKIFTDVPLFLFKISNHKFDRWEIILFRTREGRYKLVEKKVKGKDVMETEYKTFVIPPPYQQLYMVVRDILSK